jgi:predicted Zn-ribbon and HTH transcriptional regulator
MPCRQEMDAREASQELWIKEKKVYEHLVHVERSVAAAGGRFIVLPANANCAATCSMTAGG